MPISFADGMGFFHIVRLNRNPDQVEPMKKTYSLRLYDIELICFSLETKGVAGLAGEILEINEEQAHLLPLDLDLTGEGIIRWLEHRMIPRSRTFSNQILNTLGLSRNNLTGIIDLSYGLSLNDSYWIVPEGFEGTFAEYNLYENDFSESLTKIAFTGEGKRCQDFRISPELTTGGMLPKAWRRTASGSLSLYKGGTPGCAGTGREPYCETYASQIAEAMGLNAVHYDLETWEGRIASSCALFTDIDTSFVPIGRLIRKGNLAACLDYYEHLGPAFAEAFRSMLVFDALIYNEDRHFGNFGVLRDNHSGEIIAPAPIFDNGLSLFCRAREKNYANLETYAERLGNPCRISFEEICAEIMGPRQKEELRRMIGFRFRRHEKLNLPEEHLKAIEEQLQHRLQQLLAIPEAHSE